jgi:uncharacterized protein
MIFAVLGLLLIISAYFPQLWVRHVMKKHQREDPDMPGTGGELANHLIQRFQLEGIIVEETDEGRDHFDPAAKAVRLSPSNYHGRSVTAVAVAAHEVGHAIQCFRNEKIFELRKEYMPLASKLGKWGVAIMMSVPVAAIVLRSPIAIGVVIGLSVILQLGGALAYLIVLPEEWDASFNKALPILIEGEYITEEQQKGARQVLKAAALTYFAGALASILNIGRWLMVLRR